MDTEYNLDARAELSDEMIFELEEENNLKKVNNFKHHISAEPEFYGILKMSDVQLMDIIENTVEYKVTKFKLSEYQIELFQDIYSGLFDSKKSDNYFECVYKNITKIIHV